MTAATRDLSLGMSLAAGVTDLRKFTLDSSLLSIPGLSSGAVALSLPLVLTCSVDFFERVALLRLCSSVERSLLIGRGGSDMLGDVKGGGALDEVARDDSGRGPETDTEGNTAVAIGQS